MEIDMVCAILLAVILVVMAYLLWPIHKYYKYMDEGMLSQPLDPSKRIYEGMLSQPLDPSKRIHEGMLAQPLNPRYRI